MRKEIVVFFLSGKEYGIEISSMQGIENYVPLAKNSDSQSNVQGVVAIRDEVIPVIDIKKCLVLPFVEITGETKYVVVRTPHGRAAFLVDGVSKIFHVDENDIRECPSLVQGKGTHYVDFIARNGNDLVLVLNPDSLLTENEWEEAQKRVEKENMEEKDD